MNLRLGFSKLFFDASSFWERMRILYNVVLVILSIACWGREMVTGGAGHLVAGFVVLGLFGMAANLLYCAAYPVDITIQLTPLRSYRRYARWILFACGMSFASACALYVLLGDHMA